MAVIGGPIRNVSVKNRGFPVAHDADGERTWGGSENEIAMNGDGTMRILQTLVPWMFGGLSLQIDDDREDQEFLQGVANSGEEVPMTFTLASGVTVEAKGTIVGEIKMSTKTATAPMAFGGGGTLNQQ